jgi:hypothetical protein
MRRYVPLLIAGIAMLAAACSDATAPVAAERASLSTVSSESAALRRAYEPGASYVFFAIPVAGGQVRVGEFTLTFPANSVCQLNSGYGDRFWEKSCRTVYRTVLS